jgi:uncharacterized protein
LEEVHQKQSELKSTKKDLEWDVEEITKNISQYNKKLYGGTVKNPKELQGLQQDVAILKPKLGSKEDELLDLMSKEESLQEKSREIAEQIKKIEQSWNKEKIEFEKQKQQIEKNIEELTGQRAALLEGIDPEALRLYERIAGKKGCAVVRVEQGRCQGCRLALPMSDLQRARGGILVQCSSCGMILYSGQ